MLEFYEVNELEKKWEKYDRNRRKNSFLNFIKNNSRMVNIISLSVLSIFIIFGIISWIVFNNTKSKQKLASKTITLPVKKNDEIQIAKSESSIKPLGASNDVSLKLNDIGIRASEDSAGFSVNNRPIQNIPQQNINPPQNQQLSLDNGNVFNAIPKDEIIDFGKAPLPPKSGVAISTPQIKNNVVSDTLKSPVFKAPQKEISKETNIVNNQNQQFQFNYQKPRSKEELAKKIIIKEFNNKKSSEIPSSFSSDDVVSSNNINETLSMAKKAYNRGDYDSAIKWSLNSNELDKNNAESWIIFAKSNYKKGKKDDALFALETFNNKKPSKQVQDVINQIKSGKLK